MHTTKYIFTPLCDIFLLSFGYYIIIKPHTNRGVCFGLQEYNLKYVDLIEEQLNEALTTYRKPVDGDNYVRRSNQR